MTEQDKQALIKHFCTRDCGEAAKDCTIMPCHEIELIQEFQTTEPDSDTISRAKAIEAVNSLTYPSSLVDVKRKLADLPPAQPERIRGRWIEHDDGLVACECSVCHEKYNLYEEDVFERNYCPNCGADMREVTE